jgi:hypothetical protein
MYEQGTLAVSEFLARMRNIPDFHNALASIVEASKSQAVLIANQSVRLRYILRFQRSDLLQGNPCSNVQHYVHVRDDSE